MMRFTYFSLLGTQEQWGLFQEGGLQGERREEEGQKQGYATDSSNEIINGKCGNSCYAKITNIFWGKGPKSNGDFFKKEDRNENEVETTKKSTVVGNR